MYDAKLIEAIDRIIAKTPEKLSKNAELIDVLMRCKAALTAPQEMTAREYLETEARMCRYYGIPSAIDLSEFTVDDAIKMVEQFGKEHPERSEE